MTEFQLNKSQKYEALDDFTKGYVEAMFFTNADSGDEREDLANELGTERLTLASIVSIQWYCKAFQAQAKPLLDLAYAQEGYDEAQAGRDFWFTRQGHGVGYWDRSQLDADGLGDRLSKAAKSFGKAMTSIHRGWIYHS